MKHIGLTQGQFAIVDDWRFEELNKFRWYAVWDKRTQSYYVCCSKSGKRVYMHREIMETPKGMQCDHKDHDTLNNQEENLRNVTYSENQMNRKGAQKNNKVGEKNIRRHSSGYQVQVYKDNMCVFNKWCRNLDDAVLIRDEAIKKYHVL